ncbi:hypothetical protein RvY_07828 [Ramazzottius varieornatus]|uniref:BtpA n=1 Tax=Ramazzottius varieornatus TaxID=947166 RepID=A0A1D1V8K1_RAMVA|nr:hypothetical protein RvY_07828 [Ramazzottius varieornatus]
MTGLSKALAAWEKLFGRLQSVVIGVVHLHALPGTPRNSKSIQEIVDVACKEANIYFKHGVDAVIVENSHDIPYVKHPHIGPEITSYVTRVCAEIRRQFPKKPIGVQVLAGGNAEALAIAHACGLNFIRAEGFVYTAVADEGIIDACAGPLLRMRKHIGAENVMILADIKKKHSAHTITSDLTIQNVAQGAEFCLADGVIITGIMTGKQPDPQEAAVTQRVVSIPVLFGSGVTTENLHAFIGDANGLIVGSDFKVDGKMLNDLDEKRVEKFMKAVAKLRDTVVDENSAKKTKPTTTFIG